jgi:hypothetical protein
VQVSSAIHRRRIMEEIAKLLKIGERHMDSSPGAIVSADAELSSSLFIDGASSSHNNGNFPYGHDERLDGSIATEPPLDVPSGADSHDFITCANGGGSSSATESSRRVSWGDEAVYEYFITDAERRVKQRAAAPSLRKADAVRADNTRVAFGDSVPQAVPWQQ